MSEDVMLFFLMPMVIAFQDLFVVSGGNEIPANELALLDSLYYE